MSVLLVCQVGSVRLLPCVCFSLNITCFSVWSSSKHLRVYLKVCKSCDTVSLCRLVGPLTDSRARLRGRTNTLCFQRGPASSSAAPLHSQFSFEHLKFTVIWLQSNGSLSKMVQVFVCVTEKHRLSHKDSLILSCSSLPQRLSAAAGITNTHTRTHTLVTGVSSLTCRHKRSRADVLFQRRSTFV